MTSWRESVSQAAQDQLDALVDATLQDATRLVSKHGEFYPFAAVWRTGGETPELLMVSDDLDNDRPDSTVLIEQLTTVLREQRDVLDATALVIDASVNGSPAILVELEHREGASMAVGLGYTPKRFGRGAKLDDQLTASEADPRIWT